jgi:hypothetical protein
MEMLRPAACVPVRVPPSAVLPQLTDDALPTDDEEAGAGQGFEESQFPSSK